MKKLFLATALIASPLFSMEEEPSIFTKLFIYAAANGHINTVEAQLEDKLVSSPDVTNGDGVTALFMACQNDHFAVAHKLLKAHPIKAQADPNKLLLIGPDKIPCTALHIAASKGHTDIIKALVHADADANAIGFQRLTPLHLAIRNGHVKAAQILLMDGGACPLLLDENGESALELAEKLNNHDLLNCLKEYTKTAQELIEISNDIKTLRSDKFTRKVISQLPVNQDGDTALINAVRQNNLLAASNLLRCGVNTEYRNIYGLTALHLAAWIGNEEICKLLLDYGANPHNRSSITKCNAADYAHARENNHILDLLAKRRAPK